MELFEVRRMAVELLAQHGLGHWRVVFNQAKTRAGRCEFRSHEISLSAPLMRVQEHGQVREAILHEIAHALVGPEHRHDDVWRATAQRIGASGSTVVRTNAQISADWVGTCPAGHQALRHRRPTKPLSCDACSPGAFSLDALLTWTYKGRSVPMTPAYRTAVAAARARASASAQPGA